MKIKIRKTDLTESEAEVQGEQTVLQLKEQLSVSQNAPKEDLRLIFRGRLMRDAQTLQECRVEEDSVLHLAVRPANVTRPETQSQSRSRANIPRQAETIRQNNQSLNLMNSRRKGFENQFLAEGMWVDIKEEEGWKAATVKIIEEEHFSYVLHSNMREQRRLPLNSDKVAPFRTKTRGTSIRPTILPLPEVLAAREEKDFNRREFFESFAELESSFKELKRKMKAIQDKDDRYSLRSNAKVNC